MVAIAWLLVIVVISLVVVRVGTTALVLTGLSRDTAEFQAYSAFFGVGFTTNEAELVVNHPVRRRIIRHLILAGQIGVTGAIVPLVAMFFQVEDFAEGLKRLGIVVAGLIALWLLTSMGPTRWLIEWTVRATLTRTGAVKAMDYALLLRVHAGYGVSEITLEPEHPLVGRTLAAARLGSEGIVVLGITRRDGAYVGAPTGATELRAYDVLTVYGLEEGVKKLVVPGPPAPAP